MDVDVENYNDIKCKKEKPGIVYLSRIPKRMNVKQIRHVFGSFGEVGRVFLKPVGEYAPRSGSSMCGTFASMELSLSVRGHMKMEGTYSIALYP